MLTDASGKLSLLIIALSVGVGTGAFSGRAMAESWSGASEPAKVSVVPISGGLGLADITLEAEGVASAGVTLLGGIVAPMEREAGGVGGRFSVRVRGSAPKFEIGVEWTDAKGTLHRQEGINVDAEPDAAHRTPDWAKGAVWYQIFVDRFRNGNKANDPATPRTNTRPWNEPWEALTEDQIEQAWAHAGDAAAAGSIDSIGRRSATAWARQAKRYGGDLAGVAEELPYLRELGIDAIYLTPIFQARSSHKYDASDYRHIDHGFAGSGEATPELHETADPATWKLTPADRDFCERFLPAVHSQGMRVILDGVWNHVGREFWAFRDVVARGKQSPYASWFDVLLASGDPEIDLGRFEPGALLGWRGWNSRNGDLPIFARHGGTLVQPVRDHVLNVTTRWMNPTGPREQRIDGWRLDVAPDVPRPFWKEWRTHVKGIDPDALLIGELWFPAGAFFEGAAFDGQMNYPMAFPIVRFLCGDPEMPAGELAHSIQQVLGNHPATDLVQLNLLGSHDTARLATMIQDPSSGYEQLPKSTVRVDRRKRPSAVTYERVVLGVALQATLPGSPMVYYGDEVGVFGGNDPDCRKPLPWDDRGPYPPGVAADHDLRRQFTAWLTLRRDPVVGPMLRYGALRLEPAGAGHPHPDVIAFRRTLNDRQALIVVNRGSTSFEPTKLGCWSDHWVEVPSGGGGGPVGPRQARIWSWKP